MKKSMLLCAVLSALIMISCGDDSKKKKENQPGNDLDQIISDEDSNIPLDLDSPETDEDLDSEKTDHDSDLLHQDEDSDEDEPADQDSAESDEDSDLPEISGYHLIFNYEGVINTIEDASSGADKKGVADFTLKWNDYDEKMTEYATSYEFENRDGNAMVTLSGLRLINYSQTVAEYNAAELTFSKEYLKKLKENGSGKLEDKSSYFTLYHIINTSLKSGEFLRRLCIPAIQSFEADSVIRGDFDKNTEFAAGENLILEGGLNLVAVDETLAEKFGLVTHNNEYCVFMADGANITLEEYEQKLSGKEAFLNCELPEGFSDKLDGDSIYFTATGFIGDFAAPVEGKGKTTLFMENGESDLSYLFETSLYAVTGTAFDGKNTLLVKSMSKPVLADGIYSYKLMETLIPETTITALDIAADGALIKDSGAFRTILFNVEEKMGEKNLKKYCPLGIDAEEDADSGIFICHQKNNSFSAGREIGIAGNMKLLDQTAAGIFLGSSECFCTSDDSTINCADF